MPTPVPGTSLKDFDAKWFSFTMTGSVLWAFNGGYVNAICYAGVWFTGLSHLTGSTTLSAVRFVNPPNPGQYSGWDFLGFIFAWFLGALLGGIVIGNPRLHWGRLQGSLCIVQGVSLVLGWLLSPEPDNISRTQLSSVFGGWFVSFAMGVQNTITSLFSPMTLRTSHHSGTVLDIGITIGQCIHLRNMDHFWKLLVFGPNFVGFWVGAVAGTAAWNALGASALLINGGLLCLLGVVTLVVGTWQSYKGSSSSTYEIIDSGGDRGVGGQEEELQFRGVSAERSFTPPPPFPAGGYQDGSGYGGYGGGYGGGGGFSGAGGFGGEHGGQYGGGGYGGGATYGGGGGDYDAEDHQPHQRYYGSI